MSVSQSPKKEVHESGTGWQPHVLRFVAVVAVALIVLPLLPSLISNLAYSFHSFDGKAPKIYWYLSRASGFVSFTILWISMALGLGLTNKMARLWPGAPSAFAIHQYTSMLGLAFAAYHGLVLMGDHFVDFSLPHLLAPFSIAYETFWVGLGQLCFYAWLVVVLSFYVRPRIGQKAWRMIHYLNFAIYGMGVLHGIKSGTDSHARWVVWYFGISITSVILLLAHRIYEMNLKNKVKISLPKFSLARVKKSETVSPLVSRAKNLPQALIHSQGKKPVTDQKDADKQIPEPVFIETKNETSAQVSDPKTVKSQAAQGTAEQPLPTPAPVKGTPVSVNKEPKEVALPSEERAYEKKYRIRTFNEPTTKPIPELQDSDEIKFPEDLAMLVKLRNKFRDMPVEPVAPKGIPFSEG